MQALATAVAIGTVLLVIAVWIEVRERRGAPGDGDYKSSRPPQ
jgi:hypothetical protein